MNEEFTYHPHWNHLAAIVALGGIVVRGLTDAAVLHLLATYVSILAGLLSIVWSIVNLWRNRNK
jgi:hypothetical protein